MQIFPHQSLQCEKQRHAHHFLHHKHFRGGPGGGDRDCGDGDGGAASQFVAGGRGVEEEADVLLAVDVATRGVVLRGCHSPHHMHSSVSQNRSKLTLSIYLKKKKTLIKKLRNL